MKNEKAKSFFHSRIARTVIVAVAVVMIGLAVYLNYRWFYDPTDAMGYGDNNMEDNYDDSASTGATDGGSDYFIHQIGPSWVCHTCSKFDRVSRFLA